MSKPKQTKGGTQREAGLRDLGRLLAHHAVPMVKAAGLAGEAYRRVHDDGEDERAVVADIIDRIELERSN